MNKLSLILLMLFVFGMLFLPSAIAQEEHAHEELPASEGVILAVHLLEAIIVIVALIFALLAAQMMSQNLKSSIKLVVSGLVLVGINAVFEGLHHLEISVIPIGNGGFHSVIHHGIAIVGFLLLAFGFYKLYQVVGGVYRGSGK